MTHRTSLDDGQSSFKSNLVSLILAAPDQIIVCNYARSFTDSKFS
jgi:hypothetical protein